MGLEVRWSVGGAAASSGLGERRLGGIIYYQVTVTSVHRLTGSPGCESHPGY
jgi:hypothetical protein